MDSKRMGLLAVVATVIALVGTSAQATVKYETWARVDLALQSVRKVDFFGAVVDVGRPESPVLDSFSFSSGAGHAGTGFVGIASSSHDGVIEIDGDEFDTDGVHHSVRADGYASGFGASASSLHSSSTIAWDFFFDPGGDFYGLFGEGDALALDFMLDYEYFVGVSRSDASETIDALASISLMSIFPVDALTNVLYWVDPTLYPEVLSADYGVDFLETAQLSDETTSVTNSGQLNFTLVLDPWGFSFDTLSLSVDVDGFGISRIPVTSPLSLIALALFGWLAMGRRRDGAAVLLG